MMKTMKRFPKMLTATILMAVCAPLVATAQGYYDDDIYGTMPKAKPQPKQQTYTTAAEAGYYYVPNQVVDFPGADTYTVNSGSTRDVDEYNRNGQFLVSDSVSVDSLSTDMFANTRRIERFHNSDIIADENNASLATYYYSQQPQQQVNIYVNNDPWYNYPYGSWSWRYGSPWYNWSWNPGWSYYDPWISWGWGWTPGWGGPIWGPSWGYPGWGYPSYGPGWGWTPGWGGPIWAGPSRPRPVTGAGSSRPHTPTTGVASAPNRGGSVVNSYRPGNSSSVATTPSRPGTSNRQPTTSPSYRPGSSASSYSGSTSTSTSTTRGRQQSSSYNSSSSSSSSHSSSSYNSSSSSNRSSSSHSSSSGSSSRGSSGGHSGGGGGRGRR